MSPRVTTIVMLKIITSSASIAVLANLVWIQGGLQKAALTVPAHVIWESDVIMSVERLLWMASSSPSLML